MRGRCTTVATASISSDGRLLKNVNANGSIGVADEEPWAVTLPDGTYWVEARAEKLFVVKVPVVIEDGRLTVVGRLTIALKISQNYLVLT